MYVYIQCIAIHRTVLPATVLFAMFHGRGMCVSRSMSAASMACGV